MADDAYSIPTPSKPLAGLPFSMQPRGRAQRLLAGMERLQALYDEMAAKVIVELDVLDGDSDFEPSLGFLESTTSLYGAGALNQAGIDEGATDDREETCEDEGAQCDDEGMRDNEDGCTCEDAGGEGELGWSEDESAQGPRLTSQTYEYEPSLGSLDGATDQRRWAAGGSEGWVHRDFDHEYQCEDEGGQCEDEGADRDHIAPGDDGVLAEFIGVSIGPYASWPPAPNDLPALQSRLDAHLLRTANEA